MDTLTVDQVAQNKQESVATDVGDQESVATAVGDQESLKYGVMLVYWF